MNKSANRFGLFEQFEYLNFLLLPFEYILFRYKYPLITMHSNVRLSSKDIAFEYFLSHFNHFYPNNDTMTIHYSKSFVFCPSIFILESNHNQTSCRVAPSSFTCHVSDLLRLSLRAALYRQLLASPSRGVVVSSSLVSLLTNILRLVMPIISRASLVYRVIMLCILLDNNH